MKRFNITERQVADAEIGNFICWDVEMFDENDNYSYITLHSLRELREFSALLTDFVNTKDGNTSTSAAAEDTMHYTVVFGIVKDMLDCEYRPGNLDAGKGSLLVMTTTEVLNEIVDMSDATLNDVAECMTALGYHTARIAGKTGWLMERK